MKKAITAGLATLALTFLCACTHHSMGTFVLTSPAPVLDRIQHRGELVVGTAAGMPPFNMVSKDGKIIGFEADLARLLAESMEVKLVFRSMAFAELMPALEAGKLDMVLSAVTITASRNRKVAFVGPYYVSGKGLLVRTVKHSALKSTADFNSGDLRVTALAGSTSQEFVERFLPRAQFVSARDFETAVQMVINGQVDAMVADHPICVLSVARHPDDHLSAILPPFSYEPIGAALPANDPLFMNLVENFLNTLKGSGELERLEDYWFRKGDWWGQLP